MSSRTYLSTSPNGEPTKNKKSMHIKYESYRNCPLLNIPKELYVNHILYGLSLKDLANMVQVNSLIARIVIEHLCNNYVYASPKHVDINTLYFKENIVRIKLMSWSPMPTNLIDHSLVTIIFDETYQYAPECLLPLGISKVVFSSNYNSPDPLPVSLKQIIFGNDYNQTTPLPPNLTFVKFGDAYDQLTCFPESLEEIVFGNDYNQRHVLPEKLKRLTFGNKYDQDSAFPPNLESLTFSCLSTYKQATPLPSSLKFIKLGYSYRHGAALPENLEEIIFCGGYNPNLVSLKKLRKVRFFGCVYETQITFPENLEQIMFCSYYNLPTTLPTKIKMVIFGNDYNQPIVLPEGIEQVTFGKGFNQMLTLPFSLKLLVIQNRSFSRQIINIRPDVHIVIGNSNIVMESCFQKCVS